MEVDEYINNSLDNDIIISDHEIRALANLSHKVEARIREFCDNGNYFMIISFNDNNDEEILLASGNKDRYREMSREFFQKFIKYGGSIYLDLNAVYNINNAVYNINTEKF